ncbi:MAG TPA: hypothetical protein VK149_12350 [Sideroxyarcus sp.]|nr:hypothetical protein [Sideroxyarcus sp.]
MTNGYYNHGNLPGDNTPGSSAEIRAEFDAVMAGFDKNAPLSGNANKVVVINAAETAQTVKTAASLISDTTHAATGKTTPVDADELPISDSAASYELKKVTFANLGAWIWSRLGALIAGGTSKATPVTNDSFAINDSAASDATKKLTFGNLIATLQTAFASLTFSVGTATSAAHAMRLDQQQYPWRNRIINGDMGVNQIYGTTAVTPAANGIYPIDQFLYRCTAFGYSKLTFQQVADAPAGFKYSEKITVASAASPGAADIATFTQPIEGQNLIDLGFGTANNRRIATGIWIKGSVAGTYAVSIQNAARNRSYVGTIAVTNSFTEAVVTLDADSSGTWPTTNDVGLWLNIDLGSGSNFNTTAGAWQAGEYSRTSGCVTFISNAAATLNITGVQLEKVAAGATTGTEFEFLPYAENLRRCEYYWRKLGGGALQIYVSGYGAVGSELGATLTFPSMRAAPTAAKVGTWPVTNCGQPIMYGASVNSLSIYASTTAAGVAAITNGNDQYISLDARM